MKIRTKEFLNTNYPVDFSNNWNSALFTAIFTSLFITLFEPFGLSNLSMPNKSLILAGYGLIVLVTLMIDIVALPYLMKSIFDKERWTNGKHIIFMFWIFFTIGLGNYLYSGYIFHFDMLNPKYFLSFEILTLAIGIIPAIIILLWKNNTYLKQNLQSANELSSSLKDSSIKSAEQSIQHIFKSYNGKDSIELQEKDILFIESEGNYCYIYHLKDNNPVKKVLRTTLKLVEANIPKESLLFKSHRAFIINPEQINKITGNAQGYRLVFNHTNREAAVSRQYIHDFKLLIRQVE